MESNKENVVNELLRKLSVTASFNVHANSAAVFASADIDKGFVAYLKDYMTEDEITEQLNHVCDAIAEFTRVISDKVIKKEGGFVKEENISNVYIKKEDIGLGNERH